MNPALGGRGKSEGGWQWDGVGMEADWAPRELRSGSGTGVHMMEVGRRCGDSSVPENALDVGTHLRLLLREARLGCDEAQRGGVRVLVDLVEVVLQDLHLVLRGAIRSLRRHGPGASAQEAKAPGERFRLSPSALAAGCGARGRPPWNGPQPGLGGRRGRRLAAATTRNSRGSASKAASGDLVLPWELRTHEGLGSRTVDTPLRPPHPTSVAG